MYPGTLPSEVWVVKTDFTLVLDPLNEPPPEEN